MAAALAPLLLRSALVGALRALAVAMVFAQAACLLPPDGITPADPANDPPEIDPESLMPPDPIVSVNVPNTLGASCLLRFSVRLGDRDSSQVQIRWVADNRTSLVRLLDHDDDFTLPERSRIADTAIETRDITGPLVGTPHSFSLFVSDGAAWDVSKDEIDSGTDRTDFGRVKSSPDGGVGGSVIEVRWFLDFHEGDCGP